MEPANTQRHREGGGGEGAIVQRTLVVACSQVRYAYQKQGTFVILNTQIEPDKLPGTKYFSRYKGF